MADGEELENFVGAFLLSLKLKGWRSFFLKCFLFVNIVAVLAIKIFCVEYIQELGRKYMVQKKTWNNHALKVEPHLRLVLEFVFVCRCCGNLLMSTKLFSSTYGVAWPVRVALIVPKLGYTVWLMCVGVFYLVVVSYDNVEAILMDALTFEIIFDMEDKYYHWVFGGVHDKLKTQYEALEALEKQGQGETKQHEEEAAETSENADVAMVLWPFIRVITSIALTLALDHVSLQIANDKNRHTWAEYFLEQAWDFRLIDAMLQAWNFRNEL